MDKTFFTSPSFVVSKSCVFIPDDPILHVSKLTHEFLEHKISIGEKTIEWPPPNPDLNPIKKIDSQLWRWTYMKVSNK